MVKIKLSVWHFLASFWPLLLVFALVQWVMRLSGNTTSIAIPWWLSLFDLLVFSCVFAGAAAWAYAPLRQAPEWFSTASRRSFNLLEQGIITLPTRALRSFLVAGVCCASYLVLVLSVAAVLSQASLTPRVFITLALCVFYGVGVLAPAVALAMSFSYSVKVREALSLHGLFSQDLDDDRYMLAWNKVSTRPWIIFIVTSALPACILAVFVYLILGTDTASEQNFILLQAGVLFAALLLAGSWLVWTVGRVLKRVVGSFSDGLERMRQGQFDGAVPILTDDEFGVLARGINTAFSGLKEREALKHGLEIAAEIHCAMLPNQRPEIEHYAVHGFQQSCYAVGGDYYDHIILPDGRVWLIVADVAGKGYPAALTVANLRAMLHALAHLQIPFEKAAEYINNTLCDTLTGGRFVTMFMAKLQPETNSILWLNAGHMPALLYRQGHLEALEASSPPMGLQKGLDMKVSLRMLEKGDTLLAYSDGITEARDKDFGDMFGELRLKKWLLESVGEANIENLSQQLQEELEEFGQIASDDDVTMLFVRRES
ncbi:MAG: SpoIIE family protein phosphatase [Mariprofundaceae bacterium]